MSDPTPTGYDDRSQILDLLSSYAFGLDHRDFPRVASVFTSDAEVEIVFESYMPDAERFKSLTIGGDAVAAGARQLFSTLDATQHFLGAQSIEVTSSGARASTQMVAHHHRGGDFYHTGGTYEDELVRTALSWRISRRTVRIHWTLGTPDVFLTAR